MLKVLLVDDEQFILQGLLVLIDWEAAGYEIAAIASNGKEALEYLQNHTVDLVLTDIMMPEMTGLKLLETVQKEHVSEASFIIMSGYGDFAFAQQALRFGCIDYLLKPVEKEELLSILGKYSHISENAKLEQKYEQAYLAHSIISLLVGRYDDSDLSYVKQQMQTSAGVRYIEIEIGNPGDEDVEESEMRFLQRKLYQTCLQILKEDGNHCVFDVSLDKINCSVGFVYCDYMSEKMNCSEDQYIKQIHKNLEILLKQEIHMLVGKKVSDIALISQSYGTACMMKTSEAFHTQKDIYYYEEEMQVKQERIMLCKDILDALILAIEQNESDKICEEVEALFHEMRQREMNSNSVNLNINYLLFQLIHLASNLDSEANQEEILYFISVSSTDEGILRGSSKHLSRFACEYSDYLSQLRKNVSTGVLHEIEKEIKENYAENLTLRELGKKYYINSSYLGQIFRKKYGQSFKDYLNNHRINEAGKQLLNTDKKISQIAEDVGYRDTDYFICKFIELKGCSPSRFRKNTV